MTRGKQQILLGYLPNRTFDFERIAAIARVTAIRGEARTDLNSVMLLRRIAEEVGAWQEDFRPALRDDVLRQPDRFIYMDPRRVESELFPKVLWCQNRTCGRVFDFSRNTRLPKICPSCRRGKLVQLRFVKIHRCGALHPLLPPNCQRCNSSSDMALDTRGSERVSAFQWICRRCNSRVGVFAGHCSECQWPDQTLRRMDIEVHRAGRTFYAHSTVLLNIPYRSMDGFLGLQEWPALAAAKCLAIPEFANLALTDFGNGARSQQAEHDPGLSGTDLDNLMRRHESGEINLETLVAEMNSLRARRVQERRSASPAGIVQALARQTGIHGEIWDSRSLGQEMLEATLPLEIGRPTQINIEDATSATAALARNLGLARLALVSDYPITTATYGFSRADYQPNHCRLNPFPALRDYGGRTPIFVDQVQADALLVTLDPERVIAWLERNGCQPEIPAGSDSRLSRKAYFVKLLSNVPLRETLREDRRAERMVFGLLHTLSHLSVKQTALLCGLDQTSLSEYLLPRTLTFAIYCNHRFGATIGALTALFEQSLAQWLTAIGEARRCVYDPVCKDRGGSCHACAYLAETSCRFFNLNLSRAFLFGGHDAEVGDVRVGYFDATLGSH